MPDRVDDFIALPREKQLTVLHNLAPEMQSQLLEQVRERRSKNSAPPATEPKAQPGMLDPHGGKGSIGDIARGGGKGLQELGQSILHPIDTITSMVGQVREVLPSYRMVNGVPIPVPNTEGNQQGAEQAKLASEHPGYAVAKFAAPLVATEGLARGLPKVKSLIKTRARQLSENATGTSPRVSKELAKDTAEANKTAAEKAAAQNEKQQAKHVEDVAQAEAKRTSDVRKHFEKTQQARGSNLEAEGKVSRKEAIGRGIERLDTEVRGDLEKVEENVNKEANRRYEELASNLDPVEADPDVMAGSIGDAMAKIKGSDTEPAIIKSMYEKATAGPLTYEDLQGFRSELGRELRRGTLPGDVFHAYKTLQEAITDEMENIAKSKGMGEQFRNARDYYRQYAETFLDRDAVARKALDSKERGGVAKAYQGKDQSGVEQIARFDPQVAQRLNSLRGYRSEAASLPSKTGKLAPEPKLAPKPATPEAPSPVQPELKKIGSEDIRQAKEESLHQRAEKIRHYANRAAFYVTGYRSLVAVGRALTGDAGALAQLPADIGEGVAVAATGNGIASFLENPKIVKMLTQATPDDVAQIPPEIRGDLSSIVQEAQKQGIKVSPALLRVVGVGAVLNRAKQLQETRDQQRSSQQP